MSMGVQKDKDTYSRNRSNKHFPSLPKMTDTQNYVAQKQKVPSPVEYEKSVYQNGLHYEHPPFTFNAKEWEPKAAALMSANSRGYVIGNAGTGETANKNVEAFKKWSIVPKRLVASDDLPDLTTKVVGQEFQFPIAAAPVGVQRECFHQAVSRR